MAIILAFSISFYMLYHEQVYNLLLFSLILISVYQAGAGTFLQLPLLLVAGQVPEFPRPGSQLYKDI